MRQNRGLNTLIVVFLALAVVGFCMGLTVETRQEPWIPLRTAVDANDSVLDGTTATLTYAFADKPTTAVEIPSTWNSIDVYFYGTDAANEIASYKLYGYKDNGPALLLTSGVATLGTAVTGGTTTYYGDTITETDVHATSAVTDSAGNRICVLHLTGLKGISWLYCELDLPTAPVMASISCEMTGY